MLSGEGELSLLPHLSGTGKRIAYFESCFAVLCKTKIFSNNVCTRAFGRSMPNRY